MSVDNPHRPGIKPDLFKYYNPLSPGIQALMQHSGGWEWRHVGQADALSPWCYSLIDIMLMTWSALSWGRTRGFLYTPRIDPSPDPLLLKCLVWWEGERHMPYSGQAIVIASGFQPLHLSICSFVSTRVRAHTCFIGMKFILCGCLSDKVDKKGPRWSDTWGGGGCRPLVWTGGGPPRSVSLHKFSIIKSVLLCLNCFCTSLWSVAEPD